MKFGLRNRKNIFKTIDYPVHTNSATIYGASTGWCERFTFPLRLECRWMSSTHTRTMGSVNVWCWKTHKHQLLPQIHHISTLTVCLSWKFYHSNFSFGITRNKNESITICGVFKSKTICKWNLSFYSKWFFRINKKNYSNAARSRYFILGKFGGSSLIPNNYNAYAEI